MMRMEIGRAEKWYEEEAEIDLQLPGKGFRGGM